LEQPVLVTGAAGFVGMHVARRLLADGHVVVGVVLNAYYDPRLKQARIAQLETFSNFKFAKIDIHDRQPMAELFAAHRFPAVAHLAAQAGVRHSLIDPYAYADANLTGFLNVLEGCRHAGCRAISFTRRRPPSTAPIAASRFERRTMLIIP
jgi:UDP-glucuronate 4-epimerase